MTYRNSIPYGVNALIVYNEVRDGLIKVLYALHTVSGQPYTDDYVTLDTIIKVNGMENWIVIPNS